MKALICTVEELDRGQATGLGDWRHPPIIEAEHLPWSLMETATADVVLVLGPDRFYVIKDRSADCRWIPNAEFLSYMAQATKRSSFGYRAADRSGYFPRR